MNLLRFTYLISKNDKRNTLLLFFILLISILLEIAGIGVLMPFFSLILGIEKNNLFSKFLIGINEENIIIISMALFTFFYIFRTTFLIFTYYFLSKVVTQVSNGLTLRVFRMYLGMPYNDFIQKNTSEILRNLNNEVAQFINYFNSVLYLFLDITLIALILVGLLWFDPVTTSLLMLIMLLSFLIYFIIFSRKSKKWGNQRQFFDEKINRTILESIGGIKEIKIYSLINEKVERLNEILTKRTKTSVNQSTVQQIPKIYFEFVLAIILSAQIIYLKKSHPPSEIILIIGVYILTFLRILPSISRALSSLQTLRFSKSSIDVLSIEINNFEKKIDIKKSNKNINFEKKIIFNDIYFSYNNSSNYILKNINLIFLKGESIAIIGESGSGKSTFIDILLGLLIPQRGEISIDEKLINNYSNYTDLISYVPQSIYLNDDTIINNIISTTKNKIIDKERLNNIIEKMFLTDLVYSSDSHKLVGDRGTMISGGQKQRIGLARALYLERDIILLDEATNSLDKSLELEVIKNIFSLKGDSTLICITHNSEILSMFDKVIEVKGGELKMRIVDNVR